MDVCCNLAGMDAKGNLIVAAHWHSRRYFRKLQFLLCFGQGKYLLLPFVVGLLADSVSLHQLFTLSPLLLHAEIRSTHKAIFVCPFSCCNSVLIIKNTPVPRIVYATRIYYPLLYRSIVTLYTSAPKSRLALLLTFLAGFADHVDETDLPYSIYTQGLLTSGLMYQSVIDGNGNQKYSFTSIAKLVDQFAVSYDDVERYPNPQLIQLQDNPPQIRVPSLEWDTATDEEVSEALDDVFGKQSEQ